MEPPPLAFTCGGGRCSGRSRGRHGHYHLGSTLIGPVVNASLPGFTRASSKARGLGRSAEEGETRGSAMPHGALESQRWMASTRLWVWWIVRLARLFSISLANDSKTTFSPPRRIAPFSTFLQSVATRRRSYHLRQRPLSQDFAAGWSVRTDT
ncbi:hypothetical protein EJ06DRAFT_84725 [Trichodelitschia bisporula]|uniref:Uncharacterized protein n=1 Tax=Trichodelitschia bisporula TaxID=703511 RepID=A0A6G1HRY0_9PEZI|nr:hypothetical protein EJ06DRAFT_84725 [Trichodelitschia bisporula]